MTWQWVAVVVAALGFVGAVLWLVLPYVRTRSNAETRLQALEAANVALTDRVARVEQFRDEVVSPRLPRGLSVSR